MRWPRESVSQLWIGPGVAGHAARSGNVALQRVVHHHTVGVEEPSQSADGAFHALDPTTGKAVAIALVVERNHFVVKRPQQIFAVTSVVDVDVGVSSTGADREPVHAV